MWLLVFFAALCIFIYIKIFKPLKYWEEKGVPYLKPIPLFGNMAPNVFQRRSMAHLTEDFYKEFPDKRYVGIYQFLQPTLLIRDMELIKKMLVKEFDSFPDHAPFTPPSDPLFNRNLLALTSKNGWGDMRATLSPFFTSSKMKYMFILMQQCATQFISHFQNQGFLEVELKDALARYTNDVIGITAFGVNCNSFKDPDNEFYSMAKEAFNFNGLKGLKFLGYTISPFLMQLFKVTIFSEEVKEFFRKVISETLKFRKEKQIVRPDMIHLLMEEQNSRFKHEDKDNTVTSGFSSAKNIKLVKLQKQEKLEITVDDITAQGVLFFLGGFETSSTLMCHMAYQLALKPNIQKKLFEEISATMEACKDQITYEALMGMKYLDCVVSETLRLWPLSAFLDRYCVKPFTIEPELPGEKELKLEAGTICWIPVYPIHRDPKYYPDPDKFDPERFNEENRRNIKPFTYMPFGSGPRICIGSRFALLQSKLIIVEILRKFEIVPTEKTQIPLVLSKATFIQIPDGGFWLGLKPRETCE